MFEGLNWLWTIVVGAIAGLLADMVVPGVKVACWAPLLLVSSAVCWAAGFSVCLVFLPVAYLASYSLPLLAPSSSY